MYGTYTTSIPNLHLNNFTSQNHPINSKPQHDFALRKLSPTLGPQTIRTQLLHKTPSPTYEVHQKPHEIRNQSSLSSLTTATPGTVLSGMTTPSLYPSPLSTPKLTASQPLPATHVTQIIRPMSETIQRGSLSSSTPPTLPPSFDPFHDDSKSTMVQIPSARTSSSHTFTISPQITPQHQDLKSVSLINYDHLSSSYQDAKSTYTVSSPLQIKSTKHLYTTTPEFKDKEYSKLSPSPVPDLHFNYRKTFSAFKPQLPTDSPPSFQKPDLPRRQLSVPVVPSKHNNTHFPDSPPQETHLPSQLVNTLATAFHVTQTNQEAHFNSKQQTIDNLKEQFKTTIEQTEETSNTFLLQLKNKKLIEDISDRHNDIRRLRDDIKRYEKKNSTLLSQAIEKLEHDNVIKSEINSLKRLLENQERRLKLSESVAKVRQKQYQDILKELAAKESFIELCKQKIPHNLPPAPVQNQTAEQLEYLETEVTSMRKCIDELLFENQELQRLLIEKDKHMNSIRQLLKNSDHDLSTIELSAQAMNIIQNTTELKNEIKYLEQQLDEAKIETEQLKKTYEETCSTLTRKREEAATLIETLANKDMKISKLETYCQTKEKEFNLSKEDKQNIISQHRERVRELEIQIKVLNETQLKLRQELQLRDNQSFDLTTEIVRQSHYNESAEERIQNLSDELEEAQLHIEKLIKHNLAKDKYLQELESHLKTHNMHHREALFTEIIKNQQLQKNIHQRESKKNLEEKFSDHFENISKENRTSDLSFDVYENLKDNFIKPCFPETEPATRKCISPSLSSILITTNENNENTKLIEKKKKDSQIKKNDQLHALFKKLFKQDTFKPLKSRFMYLHPGCYLFDSKVIQLRLNNGIVEIQDSNKPNQWFEFSQFLLNNIKNTRA